MFALQRYQEVVSTGCTVTKCWPVAEKGVGSVMSRKPPKESSPLIRFGSPGAKNASDCSVPGLPSAPNS